MKFKKSKIVIIILSVVLVISSIFFYNTTELDIYKSEISYKLDPNEEKLSNICYKLRLTDQSSKKVIYFKKLLFEEGEEDRFSQYYNRFHLDDEKESVHDALLMEYLFSYLYLGNYDEFSSEFIKSFGKFKTIGYKYELLCNFITSEKTVKNDLLVILKVLQKNSNNLDNLIEQIGHLNGQYWVFERLGEKSKITKVEQELSKVYDKIEKNRANNKEIIS